MTISTAFGRALTLTILLSPIGCGADEGDRRADQADIVAPSLDKPDYTASDATADVAAVRAILNEQVRLWNDGDVDGFMAYYWRSDSLRFASRNDVRYGWQASLDAYKERYPDRASMGSLAFEDLDIKSLSRDWMMGFGRFRLSRSDELGDLTGLFTLLLQRMDDGWRIVHDHTSD